MTVEAGSADLRRRAADLAARLPERVAVLATLAYNYRFSWTGGDQLFRDIDSHRWELSDTNPVRFLEEATTSALRQAASDPDMVARIEAAAAEQEAHLGAPAISQDAPTAFFCAEFGIHRSLPTYAGGLGILAGDILKEASDTRLPFVGVGLLYRQGYFRQRLDPSGWQVEYWDANDPERHPMALVTDARGDTLTVTVPVRGFPVAVQVWRVDVGRVPLFLLDSELPQNRRIDRWITARLYVGDRQTRIAQYVLLGRGGMMALRAMGIDPAIVHLNEGHAALASLEMACAAVTAGSDLPTALASVRQRTVFTTHTPVAAGNETFDAAESALLLGELGDQLGVPLETLLRLGRVHPDDLNEPFGLTPFGIRMSRSTNGVSRRHGLVADQMWHDMLAGGEHVRHVTNGVHLPTWIAPEMRTLLDGALGPGWSSRARDPRTWDGLDAVSDADLWAVRQRLRERLVEMVRDVSTMARLARGQDADYVEAAARSFDPGRLTIGFARRLATYKRLSLIVHDIDRALALLNHGVHSFQIVMAGKAHPRDDAGKRTVQQLFEMRAIPGVAGRVVFLDDYDMGIARTLVAGCDVWLNLPRFPLEASGTSGMKAAVNGALNLSVRDGWWEEGWTGDNGWGFGGDGTDQSGDVDSRDANELYRILEHDVLPLFDERGDDGVAHAWVARVRAAIRSVGSGFGAGRMLEDYRRTVYDAGPVRPV